MIYQALNDRELAKREEEEMELEKAKKDRLLQMLAQQERAQNNAGKLDEIRARRAAEERERRAREKERDESLKKKKERKELMAARAKQAADKHALLDREKIFEEEEYLSGIKYMAKMDEREKNERLLKQQRSTEHRTNLMKSIDEREKQRQK